MTDVFISYSKQDRGVAQTIARRLEALGFEVWIDSRIPAGAEFDKEIQKALEAASAVLVLWSPSSAESLWVRSEATAANEANKLVAVMIKETALPLGFRLTQYELLLTATFYESDPSWIKVVSQISELAGGRDSVESRQLAAIKRDSIARALSIVPVWCFGIVLIALFGFLVQRSFFPPLTPPGVLEYKYLEKGFVNVSGVLETDDGGFSRNHTNIFCSRESKFCFESTALYRQHFFYVEMESVFTLHTIAVFDVDRVVAVSMGECGTNRLVIDFASGSISARRPSIKATGECQHQNESKVYRLNTSYISPWEANEQLALALRLLLLAISLSWTVILVCRVLKILSAARKTQQRIVHAAR